MMKELAFSQALLLTGELPGQQRELLRLLCAAAVSSIRLRLKDGLTEQDYGEDLVTAASLYAAAALMDAWEETQVEEFKAGDLTVKTGSGKQEGFAKSLLTQAEMLMKPYFADGFAFVGV